MTKKTYDLTIIGGGPVGMYAAFYAGIQGLETKLIDSLEQLGGQLSAIYPEKYIYDLPGHKKIRASEMIENLKEQMNEYKEKIDISVGTTVSNIRNNVSSNFEITTDSETFTTKSVLITAGNGAFTPRKLEIPNDNFTNIHYFVTDMQKFAGKNVVIFGGGDSAVDWALMLENVAKSVAIVHRRDEFRAHAGSVDKLKESNVKIYTPYVATNMEGVENQATHVTIEHLETKEQTILDADDTIVLFGFVSSLGSIKEWGLELDKTALRVDSKQQTNLPGIFAAGDSATFDGKIKMITTGFGEAVTAVNAAKAHAYPDKIHRHQHSSTIVK